MISENSIALQIRARTPLHALFCEAYAVALSHMSAECLSMIIGLSKIIRLMERFRETGYPSTTVRAAPCLHDELPRLG